MIDVSSKKRQKELEDFGDRLPDALSNQLPMASAPFSFIHNKQKADLAAADQYAIAQRDEQQSLSHLDEWQIAAGTTTTGHLVRSAFAKLLEDGEEDLEFKSSWGTDAYNTVLRDYDLRGSDHVMKRLSTADNAEQLHRMATDLKEQQESTRLLEQAGVKFFVAQMLDPVENAAMAAAALGASVIATPAAGAGIVAARFGKALHATAVTGAGIGAMGAGSLAGADYTLADYIATAAIGGTLSYVTAPKGPRALTQPKARQVEQPNVVPEAKEAAAGVMDTEYSLSGVGGSAAQGLDTSRIGARNLDSADLDTIRYREVAALREAQVPPETLETLRSTLGNKVFSGMQRSEHIHFVQSADQLPEAARRATDSYFYDTLTDTLFIVADKLTPENAAQTVLGGVGVRLGLERTLGTDTYDTILDSLQKLADSGDTLAKDALQKATGRDYLQAEEALARYLSAGGSLDTNLIRTVLAKLKVYLQDTFGIATELGRGDLLALVQSSARRTLRKDNIDTEATHVWSGSAAQFEQFDSRYIGTGEGNILQGWGTYTTTNKHTAGWYRTKETAARGMSPSQGGLYRITLSKVKTSDFLSWGARAQSPKVKKILRKHGLPSNLTGEELYHHVLKQMPGETSLAKAKATSEYLHSIGIKGTKYKGGAKGFNYVFYRTEDAPIDKRYVDGVSQDLKAQGQLDTLDSHGKLPPEWEAKVNEAIPQTPSEILLQQAVDAADSVVPVAKVTKPKEISKAEAPKAEPTPVGTPEAPVDVPVRTETAANTEQQVDAVLKQQGGMQDVSQGMLKKGFRFFRELASEYDKLTGGIPALQQFLSKVLDDPLRRAGLFGENASSYLRANLLKANTEMQLWENTLDNYVRSITGVGKLKSLFDFSQNHINTRLEIEDSIGRELLKRNEAARRGEAIVPHSDPELQKLIELFEETTHKSAQRAKEQGLAGMEDYERIAGYFHRSWDYEKMVRFNNANPVYHQSGPLKGQLIKNGALIEMIKASALKGMPDLADAEAAAIARAIVDRTFDKASGAQTDFMGQLGKLETDNIVEMMRASGIDEVMVESIKRRLDTVASEKSGVKYVKNRIPLDMTMKWTPADGGTPVSMAALINTDVSRLLENYQQAMAGRGALAKVGIGGDEQSIQSWMQQYFDVLNKQDLSKSQKDAMLEQMQHLIGDFTGVRPESAVLSPTMSILKAMATATMLGSTGVLQIGESSVIMARHGAMTSMRHMLQKAPVIGKLMQEIGNNPKLYEEWEAVTGMSFSSDTRIRSWKRQHEVGLVQDSGMQRLAYAQQQLVPTLTGQRLVHKMQSEALLNQNLYTLWKASKGDKDALELIKQYGNLTGTHLERIRDAAVVSKKGTLQEMRLGTLSQSELDSVTDLITRMQDHLLLASRPGYGTSYGRTAVGQLLGQFTSYVGMAHNLTLRATAEHEGALGVAKVLAYQYPMMLMVTYMNETRKGNLLDLTDDNDLKELASKALSMSSVLGLYGDVASTVLGSNSRGLAATGIMDTPGNFTNSMRSLATGDFEKAGADLVKTARSSTIFGVVPGSQFLETTLKGDL